MFFFTLLFVSLSLLVGLLLATLIDQLIWGEAFFRTVFLYPMSLSLVVTGDDLALAASAERGA